MFGSGSSPSGFPVTYSSKIVNGQLIPVFELQALTSGNAVGPIYNGGAASPATVPPNASTGGKAAGAGGTAAASPFSLRNSAVPFLLIMLIVGVLGLRYVHWGR